MFDLPGSSYDEDSKMVDTVLNSPSLQVDQHKWYPTATVDHTVIKKWWEEGKYKPYANDNDENGNNKLFKLLASKYIKVPPWIRINRIIRDIPSIDILAGNSDVSMRSSLDSYLKKKGLRPKEIRTREVRLNQINSQDTIMFIRSYKASGGVEYFISIEEPNLDVILGFVRLRLTNATKTHYLPELHNCALIRELHVYGDIVNKYKNGNIQHKGYGKTLMTEAEHIAFIHGYNKIAVISGVGVRNYYRNLGYIKKGTYMIKDYNEYFDNILNIYYLFIMFFVLCFIMIITI
jgi:ELP3 family radical SAM enzyme/protein acetyltransferase